MSESALTALKFVKNIKRFGSEPSHRRSAYGEPGICRRFRGAGNAVRHQGRRRPEYPFPASGERVDLPISRG